jgi:hypothetical protein
MPTHLERICLVIDELRPDRDIVSSRQSEPGESGLSQELESHNLLQLSNQDASSLLEEAENQSSRDGNVTQETSVFRGMEGEAFKKPKKKGSALNYVSEWYHQPQPTNWL